MFNEFKKFAMKGNVMDLAVGVVIGGAFGKIVTSLVNDLIMPIMGFITGRVNLSALKLVIREAKGSIPEFSLNYGLFLQSAIDFLIIAFAIFLIIKALNRFKKKTEETPAVTISREEILLSEIRDLLKERK